MNFDYDELINVENLLKSWRAYQSGKSRKSDVMEFERHLEDNLFLLNEELKNGNYQHGAYSYFRISDPKKRDIYKSAVKDRVVHQAIYKYLCEIYEPLFKKSSFSSRKGKGTHLAIATLKQQTATAKKKEKRCWAIKCDIRKYFENINHKVLLGLLQQEISDGKIVRLLEIIIKSFNAETGKGLPLGNITSQIFANVYLNELDKFTVNELGLVNHYVRYCDDFIIFGHDKNKLLEDAEKIKRFLNEKLFLELPAGKTVFRKLKWGIDFCGSVILPNGILLRDRTKGRMLGTMTAAANKFDSGKISLSDLRKKFDSYFGLLSHCKAHNLKTKIRSKYLDVICQSDARLI